MTTKEKVLDKYVVFTFLETLRKSGAYFKEWSETYEHPE